MKIVQKSIIILAITTLTATIFDSCKKGENDPFLSLRSRTARVSGEWNVSSKVTETTTTTVDFLGANTVTTNAEVLAGGVLTDSSASNGIITINKTEYTLKYTFTKEGAYTASAIEIETEKDTVEIYNAATQSDAEYLRTIVMTISTDETGTWNFLGGIGAAKNKESISLSQTGSKIKTIVDKSYAAITPGAPDKSSVSDTTSSASTCSMCVEIWKISQLRNKEMVVEGEINNSNTNISSSFTTSSETKGTFSMILTQD